MGVAGAIWLGLSLPVGPGLQMPALMLLAAALAWLTCRAPDRVGTVALLLAVTCAAAARGGAHRAVLERARSGLDDEALYRITGIVAEPPLRESGEPATILAIERSAPALPRGTRVRVRLPADDASEWGDRVDALVRLDAPRALANPGGFDARGAANAAALAATGRALVASRVGAAWWSAVPRASVSRWRRGLERAYSDGLTPAARELVTPLVLGDRSALSPELNARLRTGGLIHLLALSGLHVVWLAVIVRGACAALGGGLRTRCVAAMVCALLYMALAGPLPSLARAAATELVAGAACLRERALDPVQALAVSVMGLLAIAPGWAGDLGFQLSCLATLGLVTVGPWLTARAVRPRVLWGAAVPSLAAQLLAFPLLAARFHTLAWSGVLSNLLALPISGLLLVAAWLGGTMECLLPGAGRLLLHACEPLALALRLIAIAASSLPGAALATGHAHWVPWSAALGTLLLMLAMQGPRAVSERAAFPSPRRRWTMRGGWLLCIAGLAGALLTPPLRPPPGRWWLVVLDVGQGDALALGFRDGWWLIDAGPRTPHYDAGENVVLPFLRWAGVRRLEALVVTHDDGDHTGGARALLRTLPVRRVIAPRPLPHVPGPASRLGAALAMRGDTLHRTPTVRGWWPPADDDSLGRTLRHDNAAGLVLEVGQGAARALLMADVDSTVERRIAAAPGVAAIKVGHHGSSSSSGALWLAGMRPRFALLSCGRRNPFGHPAPAVLERLAASGAHVLRTDRNGALWLEFSVDSVRIVPWREGLKARAAPALRRGVRDGRAQGAPVQARP